MSEGIDILSSDHLCNSLFSCIWNIDKNFSDLQGHAGAILRELVKSEDNSIQSLTALTGFWIRKVKLHKNALMPIEKLATLLIMQAAIDLRDLSKNCARRLWNVYHGLMENEYGVSSKLNMVQNQQLEIPPPKIWDLKSIKFRKAIPSERAQVA